MNKLLSRSLQCTKDIVQYISYYQCRTISQTHVDIKKSVFISQSRDVYTNLAMEDWLYRHYDFSNHHVLMFWQNDPCIVIGRHQNPWDEVNMNSFNSHNINLARRNSGGGTVYHDLGNLNLTFFTSRKHYDRLYNLKLITKAVRKEFGIDLMVTPKFDITYKEDKKISGTASKLGRNNAYHHCTLLVNVNKTHLNELLVKKESFIESNATKSIPAHVMNLSDDNENITIESLISAIGWEYLKTNPVLFMDDSEHLKDQQGFQLINPTEEWFPGLTEIYNNLISWDWIYGKTPKFALKRSFTIPADLNPSSRELNVKINVVNGLVDETTVNLNGLVPEEDVKVITQLEGEKFNNLKNKLNISLNAPSLNGDKKKFVTQCVHKILTDL